MPLRPASERFEIRLHPTVKAELLKQYVPESGPLTDLVHDMICRGLGLDPAQYRPQRKPTGRKPKAPRPEEGKKTRKGKGR